MNHIICRFREPSSYAAMAGIFAMIGLLAPIGTWQTVAMIACGVAGVVGFFMGEHHHDHGKKK
mgnify:FL=1|jgi:hypothetical protein